MADQQAFTLTPEILLAIAKMPRPEDETEDILDKFILEKEWGEAVEGLMATYFKDNSRRFFAAVVVFLRENNYLPEISEDEANEDDYDFLDMLDSRNV